MNSDEVRRLLKAEVAKAGSARAWAKRAGLSGVYVSDVIAGRRTPGGVLLAALGLERIVTYRRVTT